MLLITPTDYWMGRDVKYADQLTDKIRDNAAELIGRVNLLITWAMRENVRPTAVASGWRPPAVNDATSNAAAHSRHLTGEAIDLRDNGVRDLASWCLRNLDALEEIGLYMEDPQWTPTWVHLQIVPPGSRRRVYIPSTKPPLVAMLPEQEQGLGEIRMIPNPMLILAVVLAFVANGFYWNAHGSNAADTRWTAKITAERLQATEAARAKETMWQGVINETVKTMAAQRAGVQRNLDIALDGLRDRPERRLDLPGAAGTDCKGGTGAELSRQDAEFLSREAARADGLRAGLEACYRYADTVR